MISRASLGLTTTAIASSVLSYLMLHRNTKAEIIKDGGEDAAKVNDSRSFQQRQQLLVRAVEPISIEAGKGAGKYNGLFHASSHSSFDLPRRAFIRAAFGGDMVGNNILRRDGVVERDSYLPFSASCVRTIQRFRHLIHQSLAWDETLARFGFSPVKPASNIS